MGKNIANVPHDKSQRQPLTTPLLETLFPLASGILAQRFSLLFLPLFSGASPPPPNP